MRDTLAPTLEVAAVPDFLWPPDGRMVEVALGVAASDRCDPSPTIALLEVRSSESENAGRSGAPVAGAELGRDDRTVLLGLLGTCEMQVLNSTSGCTHRLGRKAPDLGGA